MLSDKSASELKTHIITLTKQFADENAIISEEIAILEDAIRTSMHRIAELKKIPSTLTKQIKLAKDKLRMFDVISKFDKNPYILTLDQNVIKKMTFIKSDRKGKLFTKIKQDDGTIITYSYRPVSEIKQYASKPGFAGF